MDTARGTGWGTGRIRPGHTVPCDTGGGVRSGIVGPGPGGEVPGGERGLMGVSHKGPAFHGPGMPGPDVEPVSADDPRILSGHRTTARLGATALGRVYLAQAPGDRQVVLTVVDAALAARDGFGARFHHDAQAAGQVRALGALRVLGSGNEGGTYWIASAYAAAPTLSAAVGGSGPLPTGVVLRLVASLAEALDAMHHAGVVHGDLRPAHVLLAADGPKTAHYGLSALADVTSGGPAPAFLAPEQVAGRPAAPATDVFALGQLAAYASIGRPPFDDPSRVGQEEPDLNELPGELREIVTRCLIKDAALRPSLAQVTTMCRQAAPSAHGRPWLPGAAAPAEPAVAEAAPAAPGHAAAPVPPAGPHTAHLPPAAPVVPHTPSAVPHAAPHIPPVGPHAPPTVAHTAPGGVVHGMVHTALGWVPGPRTVRRRWGAGVAVAGLAAVVVGGFGLTGGFGGHGDGHSEARPGFGAPAPGTAAPSPSAPSGSGDTPGATGSPGPTDAPGGNGSPGMTQPPPAPDPDGGETYRAIHLPAGSALALDEQPPGVRPGRYASAFGFTAAADAFAADVHHGSLALLPGGLPGTLDACDTAAGPQVGSVPRKAVDATGVRVCVHTVDGTVALVTFRQITPPGAPDAYATVDVTVWRVADRSAESDQNVAIPARVDAGAAWNSSQIRKTL